MPLFSAGSSLFAEKRNVEDRGGVMVEVIDLVPFILGLGRRCKLLKIDIEGAEHARPTGLIDASYVETHAHLIASWQGADQAKRQPIADLALAGKIDLNWV